MSSIKFADDDELMGDGLQLKPESPERISKLWSPEELKRKVKIGVPAFTVRIGSLGLFVEVGFTSNGARTSVIKPPSRLTDCDESSHLVQAAVRRYMKASGYTLEGTIVNGELLIRDEAAIGNVYGYINEGVDVWEKYGSSTPVKPSYMMVDPIDDDGYFISGSGASSRKHVNPFEHLYPIDLSAVKGKKELNHGAASKHGSPYDRLPEHCIDIPAQGRQPEGDFMIKKKWGILAPLGEQAVAGVMANRIAAGSETSLGVQFMELAVVLGFCFKLGAVALGRRNQKVSKWMAKIGDMATASSIIASLGFHLPPGMAMIATPAAASIIALSLFFA